ncbi:16S rRNA (cytosine(967)-C(5))-methyltransferase RsmB [Aquabacterium sp.]|uniref:16S rRNA (cytosine(967)-C(5))-methyltransferase RsmB n=1 Tax=Aquabacterium sp. TaxID=1872578 RepID=UPI0035B3502C
MTASAPHSSDARSASAASLPLAELLFHAAKAVAAVQAGRSLTDALAACPPKARAGAQALAFHALRRLGAAQAVRGAFVKRAPSGWVDALLLIALSLLPLDATAPDAEAPRYEPHTVVDQAVRAVKKHAPAQSGLVNAVLRRVLREPEAVAAAVQRDPVAQWNHPRWWIAALQRDWPDHWADCLRQNNTRPPMTLRVNARRLDAPAYVARLREAGIAGEAVGSHTVVLAAPQPVQRLPGFDAGDVSVQDAAAQLAAPLLIGAGLRPGARVLDACAAPGGKTAHLLELADLDLLALDVDAERAKKVSENLSRMGLHAEVRAADAAKPASWWDGRPFDAILLDAPCSASGIVRRHPDVRWLRREADIAALARAQDALLDALWPLLAPGGRLLYCTCSVFRDEGQHRRDAFLQRTPGALVQFAPGHVGPVADNPEAGAGAPVLVPTSATSALLDGFYYALFEKRPG